MEGEGTGRGLRTQPFSARYSRGRVPSLATVGGEAPHNNGRGTLHPAHLQPLVERSYNVGQGGLPAPLAAAMPGRGSRARRTLTPLKHRMRS